MMNFSFTQIQLQKKRIVEKYFFKKEMNEMQSNNNNRTNNTKQFLLCGTLFHCQLFSDVFFYSSPSSTSALLTKQKNY